MTACGALVVYESLQMGRVFDLGAFVVAAGIRAGHRRLDGDACRASGPDRASAATVGGALSISERAAGISAPNENPQGIPRREGLKPAENDAIERPIRGAPLPTPYGLAQGFLEPFG
jgi:hypothetical protein